MREVFYGVTSQGVAPYIFVMKDMICSFFGHREIEQTEELCATVTAEIIKSVVLGCRIFYFGGFGEFDALCYKIVSNIRKEHPELGIKRVFCVPQERFLRKPPRYLRREDFEEIIYLMPSFDGWYKSIYFRNLAMIDESDIIIFYAEEREGSGAYKAFKYARGCKGKTVTNLYTGHHFV